MILFLLFLLVFVVFLKDVKYEVLLKKEGEFRLPENELKNSVILKSVTGQQYSCSFGDILRATESEDGEEEVNLTAEENILLLQEISIAVDSILRDKCYQLYTRGWWNYQICFKQNSAVLLQFHKNPKNPSEDVSIILGQRKNPFSEITAHTNPKDVEESYLAIHLEDGSNCDLTGKPRAAKLMFYCPSDAMKANPSGGQNPSVMFLHLDEGMSCNYVAKVYLQGICNFPGFGAPMVTRKDSEKIKCHGFFPEKEEEKTESIPETEEVEVTETGDFQKRPRVIHGKYIAE